MEEIEEIERRLGMDALNGRSLVQTVSQMLSSVTHMAGLTSPSPRKASRSSKPKAWSSKSLKRPASM